MGCTEERDEEWIVGGREKEKKKKEKNIARVYCCGNSRNLLAGMKIDFLLYSTCNGR